MRPLPPLIFFLPAFSLFLFAIVGADLASDRAAVVALRSAVGGRSLLWNLSQTSPCLWTGVICVNNRVTALRLPAMGLSGKLPLGIGNLTQLQTLSLRFNALSGSIPDDFANLVTLRNLYLQGNFFSGEIPDFLYGMQNLVRLNLASNNFSGEISPKFNNLTRLATLYLENNHFTGSIPDLNAPPLDQFNVSSNRLNGSIPARFSRLNASAFALNFLCGKPLQACPGTESGKKKLSGGAIAGIVIGSLIGLLLILLLLFFLCRKRSKKDQDSRDKAPAKQPEVEIPQEKTTRDIENAGASNSATARGADAKNGRSKRLVFFGTVNKSFDLEDLLRASAEVLGKGTFGTTYKATLEMGIVVAVKRLKDVTLPENEFRQKIEEVGKMVHENLVPLRAYYYSREEKLLVYDYMPIGSLSALLHGNHLFALLLFLVQLYYAFLCHNSSGYSNQMIIVPVLLSTVGLLFRVAAYYIMFLDVVLIPLHVIMFVLSCYDPIFISINRHPINLHRLRLHKSDFQFCITSCGCLISIIFLYI